MPNNSSSAQRRWQRWTRWSGESSLLQQGWPLLLFRAWVVCWQAVTLCITKPAWSNREFPPLLPLTECCSWLQIDWFWPLLLSLIVVLSCARLGIILHGGCLLLAILADQTRLQPEFISHVILLCGTLPGVHWKTIATVHLGTMWFYAGLHKLLAPRYYDDVGPHILIKQLQFNLSVDHAKQLGLLIALVEMLLGILVFIPAARRWAAWIAVGLHAWIFLAVTTIPLGLNCLRQGLTDDGWNYLSPQSWSEPIWPWNLTLMFSGLVFLWSRSGNTPVVLSTRPRWLIGIVAAMILSPLTYYLGWINPYLAHCLYSGNVVVAYQIIPVSVLPRTDTTVPAQGTTHSLGKETKQLLGLPLPPSEPIFLRYFALTGKLGDIAIIYYPRALAWYSGITERKIMLGRGEWINGVEQGHWVEYDEQGLKCTGHYVDGKFHGPWIFYNADGSSTTVEYRHGVLVP